MHNGQCIRRSTKTTNKELARKIEAKVMYRLAEGTWFQKDPADEVFFGDVWRKYLEEDARYRAPIHYDRARQCAKHFLPVLQDLKLSQITPSVLSTYKTRRFKDGVSGTTVSKELGFIRRVFSLCKKEWQLIKQSPFEFFTMPKENRPRIRFLAPGEFDKLVFHCPSWLKPMVTLARYTGLRRSNVITLAWSQVDLQNRVINCEYMKNGEHLTIPINETAYALLTSIRKNKVVRLDCPYVFHDSGKLYSPNQVSVAFRRVCLRAGIKNFRFHDLRHDFASQLVQRGSDLYRVQHLLGHKDPRMSAKYSHLRVEHLRNTVESLDKNRGGHKIGHSQKKKRGHG